jgi:hypothetical protein
MTNKTKDDFDLDTPLGVAQSVNWLVGFLKHIKDGGTWLIPRSGTVYEVRHSDKVAVKIMQMLPDPSLDKVFRAAGWKVVDNT